MNFNDVVNMTASQTPEGWAAKLTLEEYDKLDEQKKYYEPLFAKYRTKKIRDYDECDTFIGWRPIQVGIGNPIGYKYVGYFAARIIDSVDSSNVLMARILKK